MMAMRRWFFRKKIRGMHRAEFSFHLTTRGIWCILGVPFLICYDVNSNEMILLGYIASGKLCCLMPISYCIVW